MDTNVSALRRLKRSREELERSEAALRERMQRAFQQHVDSDRKEGYLPDARQVDQMAKDFAADFPDPQ